MTSRIRRTNARKPQGQLFERLERRVLLATQPVIAGLSQAAALPAAQVATPAATVAISVTGSAQWTDSGGATHPIPAAVVEIRSTAQADTDPALATTTTDDSGNYTAPSVNFDNTGGAQVFARIFARSAIADVQRDTGDPLAGKTYSIDSSPVAVAGAGNITIPTRTANNTDVGEQVFSIHTALVWDGRYDAYLQGSNLAQLVVKFPTLTRTTSVFTSTGPALHILKLDRWDWDVVGHEYGHYVQASGKFVSSKDGAHSFMQATAKPNGPGVAWSEGFATFFSIMGQRTESESTLSVPNVGDTHYQDTEDSTLDVPLDTGTGVGELDEYSVAASLYHLAAGDQGVTISDKTMFADFIADKPTTMGAAWDSLAKNASGQQRSLIAHVLGLQKVAPVELTPKDSDKSSTGAIPTFTWDKNGSNDFQIQFFTSDFKTVIDTTADLGDVATFTPSAAEWMKIFDGHSTVKWVVEGKNTDAPETPGGVPDATFGGTLDRYWSSAGTLNGPGIAIVLDVTGSMSDEIGAAQAALDDHISNIQASLAPGEDPPTVDLIVFRDSASEVISSNDLNAVKTAIDAQSASGGGDCPEPSAPALAYAGQQIGAGGTILLITDASSDPGTDLTGTIVALRAKGVTVNAFISGDCSEDVEPSIASLATASVADADMVNGIDPDAQGDPVAHPSSDFAGNGEEPQDPITVATQTPIDDHGSSTTTATRLTPDAPATIGDVGGSVQDSTGAAITDSADFFVVQLTAGTAYNIPIQTTDIQNVTVALLDTDGTTQIQSVTTQVGDPGFGAGLINFTPTTAGDYFLEVTPEFSTEATYSLQVSTNAIAGVTSSVRLFSTVANTTGGTFFFDPAVASGPTTDQRTAYQSAILNVMDSTFEPSVLTATPSLLPAGLTISVTLAGRRTNWVQGSTTVAFSDADITVNSVTVNSPTSLTASVTVAAGAVVPKFSDVTVSTKLGAATETAKGASAVETEAAPTSATLLQVQPTTLARGDNRTITILGTLTSWDSTSTLSLGPGITVNSLTVNSPTQITAQVTVDPAAALGFRVATVTTGANTDTQDQALFVGSTSLAAISSIASISPSQGNLGQHVDVSVVGNNTHFVAGVTTADFGSGVTIDSVDVTDSTHAVVHLDVTGGATPGFRDVTLTTATENATLLNGFFVAPSIPATLAGPAAPIAPALPFVSESADFTVTLGSTSQSPVTIDFGTTDGSAVAGTDYIATAGTLTIPAGQSSGIIHVPLITRTTSLASDITFTLTLSNPSGGVLLGSPSQATATIHAETITSTPFDAKTPLTYTGSGNQTVKVLLRGTGTGTAYFVNGSADPTDLAVDGSTLASSLVIVAPAKTPATIGGIGINGSLASFSAANSLLNGDSEVTGQVPTVVIGGNAASGNRFTIDNDPVAARAGVFVLHHADGLVLKTAAPVRVISVQSWVAPAGGVAGSITAPSLLSLVDTGNFAADVTIAGTLGTANIIGQVTGGTWSVGASALNIVATHGTAAGWAANITGTLGVLSGSSLNGALTAGGAVRVVRATGDMAMTITAPALTVLSAKSISAGSITTTGGIQVVSVAGNLTASINAATIGTVSVGGVLADSKVLATTSINVVVLGSITNSDVFSGVAAGVTTLPTSAAQLSNLAGKIGVFVTRISGGFTSSDVATGTVRTASIRGGATTGAGGIAASNFGSLVFIQAGHRPATFTTRRPGATPPTLLGTDFLIEVLA
jgi:hypothetical protein